MTKSELREKIRSITKQIYQANTLSLDNGNSISLDVSKFPVLGKFPELKTVIVDLFTSQFEIFISRIEWVAPRPTTFRVVLANDEDLYLIYTSKTWIIKVEGKKFYLANLGEEEQAVESISRLLSYGKPQESDTETSPEGGKEPTASGGKGDETDTNPSEEEPE